MDKKALIEARKKLPICLRQIVKIVKCSCGCGGPAIKVVITNGGRRKIIKWSYK